MESSLSVSVRQHKLLSALTGIHFAGIDVSLGVHGNRVDPMELASHAAIIANGPDDVALFSVMDPDLVVRAVCNQHVLLIRVMRERKIIDRPAHAVEEAARSAAFRSAR